MRTGYLLIFFAASFVISFAVNARATAAEPFNNASISGNYAVIDIGRGGQTRRQASA
jgi:hypothetical protein